MLIIYKQICNTKIIYIRLKGVFIVYLSDYCSLTRPLHIGFLYFDTCILTHRHTHYKMSGVSCPRQAAGSKLWQTTTKGFPLQGAIMHVDFECCVCECVSVALQVTLTEKDRDNRLRQTGTRGLNLRDRKMWVACACWEETELGNSG